MTRIIIALIIIVVLGGAITLTLIKKHPSPSVPLEKSADITKSTTDRPTSWLDETKKPEYREYVVIDNLGSARVLSSAPDGVVLGRLSVGKRVEILEKKNVRTGRIGQTWYKIDFNGKMGWISQYVTTGNIYKEPVGGGETVIERAPYADEPRQY